jgi:periplasmic protein TonB
MSDAEWLPRPSRTVWYLAALAALTLHAGAVTTALTAMQPEPETELGAPAIEIGVELASPRIEESDLPVGPDTQAAAASPAVVEQKEVTVQSDLPKAPATETDDPDRVVTPNETKKPDDDPKIPTVQTSPSAESAPSEETATPSIDKAVEAPRSVAPAAGTADSARHDRVTWQRELAAHLDKHKRYPGERVVQRAEVVVSFVLDRLGHVLSKRVVKGSGDAAFDAAALEMLQRSDPVPPPPPLVADDGLTFSLPVIFHAGKAGNAK